MLQVRSYKYLMIQMVTVTDKKSIVDRPRCRVAVRRHSQFILIMEQLH